jgi:hypothetical protein
VVYVIENTKIVDELILHYTDTMKIVGELMILSNKHKVDDFAIDCIGVGKGIADRLHEMGKKVNFVNSAAGSSDVHRFYNLRAEMWWYCMERILSRQVDVISDPELRRQLSSVRYKVVNSNGQIKIEAKDEVKKRIGRSPDRADAFIYGLWALKDVNEASYYNQVDLSLDGMMGCGRGGY